PSTPSLSTLSLHDALPIFTGDIASIEGLVLSGIARAASYVLRIVFYAGALIYLRWELALVSFTVAPFFWFSARRFAAVIRKASRDRKSTRLNSSHDQISYA